MSILILFRDGIFQIKRLSATGLKILHEGPIESMKIERDFVHQATTGQEVGIVLGDKSIRFEEDDIVELIEETVTHPTMDWYPPGF